MTDKRELAMLLHRPLTVGDVLIYTGTDLRSFYAVPEHFYEEFVRMKAQLAKYEAGTAPTPRKVHRDIVGDIKKHHALFDGAVADPYMPCGVAHAYEVYNGAESLMRVAFDGREDTDGCRMWKVLNQLNGITKW